MSASGLNLGLGIWGSVTNKIVGICKLGCCDDTPHNCRGWGRIWQSDDLIGEGGGCM